MTVEIKESPKLFHFLVAGNVAYRVPSDDKDANLIGMMPLNGIITSTDSLLTVRMIGKAQQTLQMHFRKKVNDPEVEVVDVIITNISDLGYMTTEEFHAGVQPVENANG